MERQYRTVFRRCVWEPPETNRYLCPQGKLLRPQGRFNNKDKRGFVVYRYEASIVTARLASANPSAAQKTRAAAVDCYGEWRIPQFWRFEKRWPLQ